MLSDADQAVGKAYDTVRAEGEPYAEHGLPRRYTYLIGPDGNIAGAFDFNSSREFDTHGAQVLARIEELRS